MFGATSVSFYLLTSEFQNNGQAFVQSKKHLTTEKKVIAPHLPSLRYVCVCRYVCVHAPVDVHVLGGAGGGLCAALSSGGTYRLCQCNSVGDIAAVCTASFHFPFFFFLKKTLFLHWQRLCIWAHSILLLFSSLLLFCFFWVFFVFLVVLDRLKLL